MALGDIVKVTPSSKVVGDMTMFLVTRGIKPADVVNLEAGATPALEGLTHIARQQTKGRGRFGRTWAPLVAHARRAVDRADQALKLVDDKLRKTRILAPFDCTVLTRPVSLGQTVSGSGGFNSGTEVMSIANLNDMVVNAHVNQADVVRLQVGRDVQIQAESVPGTKMRGVVERVAPQAVVKNGIKGFSARIAIKEIDPRIRPGMTALLSIPVSSADNVLAVPLAAVFSERGERSFQTGHCIKRREDSGDHETLTPMKYPYTKIQDRSPAIEVPPRARARTRNNPRN